jgi:lysophospholipase L1-like esterase
MTSPEPAAEAAPLSPPVPWPRRLVYLAVPFALFFAALFAVELVVRARMSPVSTLEAFVQAPEQRAGFADHYQFSGIFEGDPRLFWRVKPNLARVIWDFTPVSTNAEGLRYPRSVGAKKPRGFRIVCLGDSVTFGYRVPTVWPERPESYDRGARTFSEILEIVLGKANPDREIEVVPYAVPGYSSHQGVAWARELLPRIKADVVIACYGWNDINLRARTDRQSMDTGRAQVWLRRLMAKSQALAHASMWWQRRGPARQGALLATATTRVTAAEYVENLSEIVALARRHGGAGLVLGPVYRDQLTIPDESTRISEHRRVLREALTKSGTPYLEIPELTEAGWPDNEFLFGEKIHPSALGHRLMAKRLLEAMSAGGMLAGLQAPGA